MAQENWVAIRQPNDDAERLLRRYGFELRSEEVNFRSWESGGDALGAKAAPWLFGVNRVGAG